MEIAYRYNSETHTKELAPESSVADLLKLIGAPPDSVLVTLRASDGVLEPIPMTRPLSEGDYIELVGIASGG